MSKLGEVQLRPKVTHAQLMELYPYFYESGTPIVLVGPPGIGKTYMVRKVLPYTVLEYLGEASLEEEDKRRVVELPCDRETLRQIVDHPERFFVVVPIHLTMMNPEDIAGIPIPVEEEPFGKVVQWSPLKILRVLTLPKIRGILFLDEIFQVEPAKQAPALRILYEKAFTDWALSEGVHIVAASNRPEDLANIQMATAPLITRGALLELQPPDAKSWVRQFAAPSGEVHETVIAFLSRPEFYDLIYKFDEKTRSTFLANQGQVQFPTPRGWHNAGKTLLALDKSLSGRIGGWKSLQGRARDKFIISAYHIVWACCGQEAATKFRGFLRNYTLIDPEEVLKKPELMKTVREIDVYPVVAGMIAVIKRTPESNRVPMIKNLLLALTYREANAPEWASLVIQMVRLDPSLRESFKKVFRRVTTLPQRVQEMLKAVVRYHYAAL